jgi:N-methylhydantoinase A/oxoprolinase/acetone carboxylase beta subunit
MSLRLGIDVGGTNTDAVVLDHQARLLARAKTPTTPDVTTGIRRVLQLLIAQTPALDPAAIRYAMLGTTHCTNAVIERRNLNRVGLIRLGAPATLAVPPYADWPADLRTAIEAHSVVIAGGLEFDGTPTVPLDESAVRVAARSYRGIVDSVAIVGAFATVDGSQEARAAALVREIVGPQLPITLSHEIGSLGLLERENAAILNAALVSAARTAAGGFAEALAECGIPAQTFFSQNDGTLMALEYAMRYPILTVASGPTNSMRGAAFLSGLQDAVVVDVGGTSTDVGVLIRGFPREAAVAVDVGGVRTNFRTPDLLSIAIGGGTRIETRGGLQIGPASVGYRLSSEALIFGGTQLTLSDAAVAAGRAAFGNAAGVAHLDRSLVDQITAEVRRQVEEAIDRVKTSAAPLPIILVGGGSVVIPTDLAGAGEVIRPADYDVANAIGAAIAQCSGEIERVFSLERMSRAEALAAAQQLARDEAIRAGADPATVEIIDLHEVPLAYMPGNSVVRIRARAAGNLVLSSGAAS